MREVHYLYDCSINFLSNPAEAVTKAQIFRIDHMYNLGQNTFDLFQVLTPSPSTKNETKLSYYDQKMNIRVAS